MRLVAALVGLVAALGLAGSGGAGVPAPPTPSDTYPTWSPDASVIVFTSTRDAPTLRVVNPDGAGERQIPWLPGTPTYSFSPDWSHIAFQADNRDIVVERLDGSNRVDLGPSAYLTRPSWSADGTRITYVVQAINSNTAYVVVARIDGSEVRRIAEGIEPAWSPAEDRIAYLKGQPGDFELHVVDPHGAGDRIVTTVTGLAAPTWSPDGTRIAATFRRGVAVFDVVTGREEAVARSAASYSQYAWSPRSDALAYALPAGIRILDVATGRVRSVASFGFMPAWSPDGRQLAFAGGGECRDRIGIYRVDVRGPAPQRITNDCRIVGTEGNDTLVGTPLADVLVGLGGNDVLTAVAQYYSGDTLEGGEGDDVLLGSYQSDTLDGGLGNDVLRGGPGPDLLIGGPGRDVIQGEGGKDLIYARDGEVDTVSCGTNRGSTTGREGDVAYVDAGDKVSSDCEWVYRPGPARPVHGRIRLTITVWPKGNLGRESPRHVYELTCRPARGTLPHPGATCSQLQRIQNPLAPIPPATPCTLVFAGPQQAAVGGVYGGRAVSTGFNRQSSCAVARWNQLRLLFPLP